MKEDAELPAEILVPSRQVSGLSLRRVLQTLRRKWWIVALGLLLPLPPTYYFYRHKPPAYSSKGSMWVRGALRMVDVGQFTEDAQNFFGTQIQLLQSDTLKERALNRLRSREPNLKVPSDAEGRPQLPVVLVSQAPRSSVFLIEVSSPVANFARAYLAAIMDEFLVYKREVRASAADDALASVSAQVFKQEGELKQEQEKLIQFQRENNIALLEESVRGGGNQLAQLNAQLALLRLDLQLLDASAIEKRAGVDSGSGTNHLDGVADLGLLSGGVPGTATRGPAETATAEQQVHLLKAQREELGKFMRPKHPKIVRLNEEIARAEKVIEFYRGKGMEQVEAARESIRLKIRSLESTTAQLAEKVREANTHMADLERIRTSISRQQGFYDRLLTLLQGLDLNSSLNQESVAILRPASAPARTKQGIALLAIGPVAGLALSFGLVLLFAYRDDRFETLNEVQAQFFEDVFGQLPDLESKGKGVTGPLLLADDARHIFAESCRSLRSALLFRTEEPREPRVVLVTSAAPNEGKSTIAVNLARALAFGGASVLLVDGDLRRGHLHKVVDRRSEPGLTDCIQSGGDLKNFVQPTDVPNLSLLARGKFTSGPGEIFLNPAYDRMLATARERYEFVVIDSIPVFAADDVSAAAPKSDGVLFVLRRGFTSARLAQEALEILYRRQAKIMGIVFNRANSRSKEYGYYKYAQYYGNEGETKQLKGAKA